MNAPTPQLLSATLWNQLLALGDDDRVVLDRINWQLRKLVKERPTEFYARAALAYGLLLSGDRDGGIQHIEAVRGFWHPSDCNATYDLMSLLFDAGQLSVGQNLLDRFIDHEFSRNNKTVRNASRAYAIRSGEVEWISRGVDATGIEDYDACEFIGAMKKQGLSRAFQLHQQLVESVVGPFSCTFHASIGLDDTGRPMASARYNTSLIGRERLQLYRRIAELKVDPDVIRVSSFISCGILGPQIQSVEVAA